MPEWVKSSRTSKEVREFVEGLDGPRFGGQDSPARKWARYFLLWLGGEGRAEMVMVKLEACLAKDARKASGAKASPTPTPVVAKTKAPAKAPTPAVKKAVVKKAAPKAKAAPKPIVAKQPKKKAKKAK